MAVVVCSNKPHLAELIRPIPYYLVFRPTYDIGAANLKHITKPGRQIELALYVTLIHIKPQTGSISYQTCLDIIRLRKNMDGYVKLNDPI